MKTPLQWFLIAVISMHAGGAFSAAAPNGALVIVNRAIDALGGESALSQVRTLVLTGNAQHWEPQSSVVPGGDMKFTGDSSIVVTREVAARAVRIDWDRKKVGSTGTLSFKYGEVYADGVGYVDGINSTARTRQSRASNPPRHTMSGIRLATFLRETHRAYPLLVLDMKASPRALTALPDQSAGGKKLRAVRYDAGRYAFTVLFDAETGLPARVRSLESEPIEGDLNYDLVLSDWRAVNGVKFAHAQALELGKRTVAKIVYGTVAVNAVVAAEKFEIPYEVRARRILPAMGSVPYQWIERRTMWGNFRDTDELMHVEDIAALTLMDLAPGVVLTNGGTHNSLIVEMKNYLIVFDAPIHEQQSRWTIDAAKAKYKKPVKYLVMTHHHWDHANGARTYVAEGAAVIVGVGNKAHFERMFAAPHAAAPDELQRSKRKAMVIEVKDKKMLSDGKREVGVYAIENSHSTGTLIGMVHDAKLGFVADIWSPGRDPLPKKPSRAQVELVKEVKRLGLQPERFAGGHGTFGNYRELAALVDRTAAGANSSVVAQTSR